MEDVAQSPGLAAILTSQYQVDRPRKMSFGNEDENVSEVYDESFTFAPRVPTYPWNKSIDPMSGSFIQERSDSTASTVISSLGTDQCLAIVADKLARVTKSFLWFNKDSTRKYDDLGNVIYNLRVANDSLKRELVKVRTIAEDVARRTTSLSSSSLLTPLAYECKQSLANKVLGLLNLHDYALKSELYGLTSKSELSV